jgi:cytochrome c-type biogenesis protein CcmH
MNLARRATIIFACLLMIISNHVIAAESAVNAAASAYKFSSPQDAERFSTLTKETRCVVCQFQNIADSNAPLAGSIRDKIYQLIQEKQSDEDIKIYLVKRYGEVILLKPRFNPMTAILWLFPLLALMIFAYIMSRVFRRESSHPSR